MGNIFDRKTSEVSIAMLESLMNKRDKELLDRFYPVGTYYETSDARFDPNKKWGGTWELDNGRWHRIR